MNRRSQLDALFCGDIPRQRRENRIRRIADDPVAALRRAGATLGGETATHRTGGITKATLYELGLSGRPDSAARRRELLKKLDLPEKLGANALLDVLNALYDEESLRASVLQ